MNGKYYTIEAEKLAKVVEIFNRKPDPAATDDLIETWVEYKRKNEVDAIRLRPHPYEFSLYYDI